MPSTMLGTKRDNVLKSWKRISPEAARFLLPIRTKKDYHYALGLLEETFADETLEPFVHVLSERIEAYEQDHFSIPDASAGEVLAFLIEQKHLIQQEVARDTGIHQSVLSRLIKGEREPTLEHVRILAKFFEVDRSVFV
jgi:HTH-type transcriptional regulator / antitoxin HigA